jgi:hypothetical protein
MSFDNINFKKVDKNFLKAELQNPANKLSKNLFKDLLKKAEVSILNGDYLVSSNILFVTLFYEPEETFYFIKKKGLFRYSKYASKKCIVKTLASELIEIGKNYGNFSQESFVYLDSIINYATISESYKAIEQTIIKEFRIFEKNHKDKSIIKTLLSATDYLFLSNYYPENVKDLSALSNRTKEEISSAVSFLIHFYTDRIKSTEINISRVDEEYIRSGAISRLIIPACYFIDFREFEIMIDCFKYTCTKEIDKLYIKPPFDDFEKSIRAGYIRAEIQTVNDLINVDYAISLDELIDKLNNQDVFKFFKKTETNDYPRYRLEVPEHIFDFIVKHFMKPDALFKEEIMYLSSVFKEQLINPKDLENIKIIDDLTLFDFIKIRRVFLLFFMMFAKAIYEIEKVETDLLLRSLIPMHPEEQFFQLMEKLFPTDKIESFLDIVCWEPGLDFVFDLQYHPIIYLREHFIIPLSIFANSDTIRNLYASQYKKANNALLNTGENLVSELTNTFKQLNIPCYSETNINVTDIDVCAIYEDTLFVFECKHTLHPVSPFDLRTTYDYIKKAESQLDKINQSFIDGKLLEKLKHKLKVETDGITRIVSCIVLSNRIFNGNIFKYPVRYIHEIKNLLKNGEMRTEDGVFSVWEEGKLTNNFMLDYFSLSNKLTTLLMDSLSKRTFTYELAFPEIMFDKYYLDSEVAIPKLKNYTDNLEKIKDN